MAQATKFLDITRSYVPVDPRTFPNNLHGTTQEDAPEDAAKVVPYEGKNFLPTSYGYKSYFGTASKLGIDALTSRVDKILLFQTLQYDVLLVALCEDGIWTKKGTEAGAWTHQVTLTYNSELPTEWTYCVLNNDLYCYRAGSLVLWKIASGPSITLVDMIPAGMAVPTLTTGAAGVGEGLTAGSYSYAVAYKNANGLYSAPTAFTAPIVVGADGYVILDINPNPLATTNTYRVYRKLGEEIKYFDDVAIYDSLTAKWFIYDLGQSGTVTTLPDASWLSNPDVNFQAVQELIPTFLNMEGQLGIFSAGMRLGFWDSMNSVAWSSIDDLTDFTPSIETLSGSAIFSAVLGKIVTILPHGDDFIIYSTKNITWVRKDVAATFQWQSTEILNAGIAYSQEATSFVPNTEHYVKTAVGLYTIKEGSPELIVPEVYDYLKTLQTPVYLKGLEGRYLFLEILDKDFLTGQVQFAVNTIPAEVVTFPITTDVDTMLGDGVTVSGSAFCATATSMNEGAGTQDAGAAAAAAAGLPPAKPGTAYKPTYTAYFSYGHAAYPEDIAWVDSPCIPPFAMSPGNVGKLDRATQDATNKFVIPNTTFDTLSFYSTQLAIWRLEEEKREAFLAAILGRVQTSDTLLASTQKITPAAVGDIGANGSIVNPYITGAETLTPCTIGTYIAGYSPPFWGMNSCSFWVGRFITKVIHLESIQRQQDVAVTIIPAPAGGSGWYSGLDMVNAYGSGLSAVQTALPGKESYNYLPNSIYQGQVRTITQPGNQEHFWSVWDFESYRFENRQKKSAFNTGQIEVGIFGVDIGYLEQSGWSYVDANDVPRTVAKGTACIRPTIENPKKYPPAGSNSATTMPMDENDGSMCGKPFEPVSLPGISATPIVWTPQSVTLPPSAFLLQKGGIAPIYPTVYGALVYDTYLKKWGKIQHEYKQLVDFIPVNTKQGEIVPVTSEAMKSGLLNEAGEIRLFDERPTESYMTIGKIGYYRHGFTECEEVNIQFKEPASAQLELIGSINAVAPEAYLSKSVTIEGANSGQLLASMSAKWYNIIVRGIYDISYLEFRGSRASRR